MTGFSTIRVDRILGRSLAPSPKSSQNISYADDGKLLAYACGSIVTVRQMKDNGSGSEIYLSLPRVVRPESERSSGSTGTPSQLSRKDSASILSFEEFAEPSKGKEKTKPVVSVAVSPDGRWVACGEQGQAPRICLWDMKGEDPQAGPAHIINVHSYGVKHLCFSPGSHFLASIGYLHDGTIHVWDLRCGVRKVASNRVTANVRTLIWVGNRLLSIGTRHVRLWSWHTECASRRRRSSTDCRDTTAVLEGRNIVLSGHVHSDFVAGCAVGNHRALVATSQAICFLDADDKHPLQELFRVSYHISALAYENSTLLVGDARGIIRRYHYEEYQVLAVQGKGTSALESPNIDEHEQDLHEYGRQVTAIYPSSDATLLVALADGAIFSSRHGYVPSCIVHGIAGALALTQSNSDLAILVAQDHGVIKPLDSDHGHAQTWQVPNEDCLSVVKFISDGEVVYGTSSGQICYACSRDEQKAARLQAHEGEVLHIAQSHKKTDLISFGKDRMLQHLSFTTDSTHTELLVKQTFDEHTAGITGAVFLQDKFIVSSSADRTIIVRLKVIVDNQELYTPSRIVDLKSMATSIATTSNSTILISCLDKSLLTLNVESGELRELCKTEESYDLLAVNESAGTCCCVSLTDKSICLRALESGTALSSKGYGHTDRITSIEWSLDRDDLVLSTGADGLVIYWWFQPAEPNAAAPSTPVRKIKTKMETLRLGYARSSNTMRRSSSVPRLSTGTPSRALSPSKLGLEGRSPSPKRSSGAHASTTTTRALDERTSPSNDRSMVKNVVKSLSLLEQKQDVLDKTQIFELRNAAAWLSRSPLL